MIAAAFGMVVIYQVEGRFVHEVVKLHLIEPGVNRIPLQSPAFMARLVRKFWLR